MLRRIIQRMMAEQKLGITQHWNVANQETQIEQQTEQTNINY